MKKYQCIVCGWIYNEAEGWPQDGIVAGTKWEDIPDDWTCPDCGVSKVDFELGKIANHCKKVYEINPGEYDEYIPNNKYLWNQRTFDAKLKNIIKVLNDLDADIIALQEIENENLIKLLKQKLPQYSYYTFSKYPSSAVGLGFLSKIPIKNSKILR